MRDHRFVQEGDLVILFMSRDKTPVALTATPGQTYVNSYGTFTHDSIIGKPFGSTLRSSNNKGFLMLLRPTPELWTQSLPHRTQILYAPDMSFIALKLGLTPGAKVVEAGTGSGSFTHFLARCVARDTNGVTIGRGWRGQPGMGISSARGGRGGGRGREAAAVATGDEAGPSHSSPSAPTTPAAPSRPASPPFKGSPPPAHLAETEAYAQEQAGKVQRAQEQASATTDDAETSHSYDDGKVWTFEFHAERERRAREEFEHHGLCPKIVSISHRNVCLNGFPSSLNGLADAVFLDLPAPWEAVPFLPAVLDSKVTTRVCCFSPCIEQVLRTVKALSNCGFHDVETYEVLVRTHESVKEGLVETPARHIGDVQTKLLEAARKRERVSEGQRQRAKEKKAKILARQEGAHAAGKTQDGNDAGGTDDGDGDEDGANHDITTPSKKPRSEREDRPEVVDDVDLVEREDLGDTKSKEDTASTSHATSMSSQPRVSIVQNGHGNQIVRANVYSRIHPTMRGHTSYLTFASLLPRSKQAPQSTTSTATASVESTLNGAL